MKILNLGLLLIFFVSVKINYCAAYTNRYPGPRSVALSNSTVALTGIEGLFHNQAAISYAEKLSFSFSYESRFLLKELSLMSAGFVLPTRLGTFGGSIYQFGKGVYYENKIGLAFARQFGSNFSAGLQFDYFAESMPENSEPFQTVTIEGGVLLGNPEKFCVGLHLFNPIMSAFNFPSGKRELPWSVRFGQAWKVSSDMLCSAEVEKTQHRKTVVKTGLEYSPHPHIVFRAGLLGRPLAVSAGAGFVFGKIRFDIAFSYQGNLGYSPSAGIQITP